MTHQAPPQRVRDNQIRLQQQRVIDNTPIITVLLVSHITNAPPILQAQNPTAKRTLKGTPHLHQRITWNNTPGAVPKIISPPTCTPLLCMSPRKRAKVILAHHAAPAAMPSCRRLRTFVQQAITVLTTRELATADTTITPCALVSFANTKCATCFEHITNPDMDCIKLYC